MHRIRLTKALALLAFLAMFSDPFAGYIGPGEFSYFDCQPMWEESIFGF